jgi:hypothetical protein
MAKGENGQMNTQTMTSEQIRLAGLEVLTRELGPVGMVRFLQQFETGRGDYSVDRHEWLDQLDVQTVVQKIKQRRKAKNSNPR